MNGTKRIIQSQSHKVKSLRTRKKVKQLMTQKISKLYKVVILTRKLLLSNNIRLRNKSSLSNWCFK